MKLYYTDVVPYVKLGDVVKIYGTHIHPPATTAKSEKANERYNSTIIFPERESCCKVVICGAEDQDNVQCRDAVAKSIAKSGIALSLDDFFDNQRPNKGLDTAEIMMLVCVVKISPELPGGCLSFHYIGNANLTHSES